MGTLIAVVIIIALIFYALKDLLADKDFSAWTNIALTSLILFTVILSIFMIMHKPADYKPQPKQTPAAAREQTPEEKAAEEKAAKERVAAEYVLIEQVCKEEAPAGTDCPKTAADVIIKKYNLEQPEWEAFNREAQAEGLFEKARAKQGIK